jgi:cyclin A
VNEVFKFQSLTFQMAVNFVDRFLSVVAVQRSKLQLVGTSCLVLAAKYEEAKSVSIEQFVFLCGNRYSSSDIVKMESQILMVWCTVAIVAEMGVVA